MSKLSTLNQAGTCVDYAFLVCDGGGARTLSMSSYTHISVFLMFRFYFSRFHFFSFPFTLYILQIGLAVEGKENFSNRL